MFWLLRLSSLTNNQISRFSWLIIHTKADVKKKKMFQRSYINFLRVWKIYHDFYQYLPKMINFGIIDSIPSKMRSSINYNACLLFKIDYFNLKHLDGTKKFLITFEEVFPMVTFCILSIILNCVTRSIISWRLSIYDMCYIIFC